MKKIFLLLEDYHELVFLETMLKKIGWDTMGAQQEVGLSGKLLSFAPDIYILQARGNKIHGINIAKNLRAKKKGQIILVLHKKFRIEKEEIEQVQPNALIMSPISSMRLFVILEKMGGISAEEARNKLKSLKMRIPLENSEGLDEAVSERSDLHTSEHIVAKAVKSKDRASRYNSILQEVEEPGFKVLDKDYIKKEMEKLAKEVNPIENAKLNEQRQSFVVELFKKAREKKKV